jgi:hypothetical protein
VSSAGDLCGVDRCFLFGDVENRTGFLGIRAGNPHLGSSHGTNRKRVRPDCVTVNSRPDSKRLETCGDYPGLVHISYPGYTNRFTHGVTISSRAELHHGNTACRPHVAAKYAGGRIRGSLVAAAGGFLDGALGEREVLQQRVVEREPVCGAASDLEPTDLRTSIAEAFVHLVCCVVVVVDTRYPGPNVCKRIGERLHAGATFGLAASSFKIGESHVGFVEGYVRRGECIFVMVCVVVFMRHGGQHNGLGCLSKALNPYPGGERAWRLLFLQLSGAFSLAAVAATARLRRRGLCVIRSTIILRGEDWM